MKNLIKPNTFLIGVQKSATTSLYNWVSQHPQICAPSSLKDIPFFIDDTLYEKGFEFLHNTYKKYYTGQKVIIQGNVNYIFFEKSIKRIHQFNPDSKLFLVLRNPVDRAISSYFFARKRGIELNPDIVEAFKNEENINKSLNFHDLCELTYKEHGLYAKQLSILFNYFKKEQVCILLFNDLKKEPFKEIKRVFEFLGVDPTFKPKLNYLNETGEPRSKLINQFIYRDSKLKKLVNKYIADKFFSFDFKIKVKLFLGRLFSKKNKEIKKDVPEELITELKEFFMEEIVELEKITDLDLSIWKK